MSETEHEIISLRSLFQNPSLGITYGAPREDVTTMLFPVCKKNIIISGTMRDKGKVTSIHLREVGVALSGSITENFITVPLADTIQWRQFRFARKHLHLVNGSWLRLLLNNYTELGSPIHNSSFGIIHSTPSRIMTMTSFPCFFKISFYPKRYTLEANLSLHTFRKSCMVALFKS